MALRPHEITTVIQNDFPSIYSGSKVEYKWDVNILVFIEGEKHIFCANPALLIVNADTQEVIFKFRTQTPIRFTKPQQEDKAIELALSFFETAKDGFNWHMKDKCHRLAFCVFYPDLKAEDIMERIRAAYLDPHPYIPLTDN